MLRSKDAAFLHYRCSIFYGLLNLLAVDFLAQHFKLQPFFFFGG